VIALMGFYSSPSKISALQISQKSARKQPSHQARKSQLRHPV
jgi:hypothetical protein